MYGRYSISVRVRPRWRASSFTICEKNGGWVATNTKIFEETGKLVEKYDVVGEGQGGGGEYPLQDGFGWTNGVLAALLAEDKKH